MKKRNVVSYCWIVLAMLIVFSCSEDDTLENELATQEQAIKGGGNGGNDRDRDGRDSDVENLDTDVLLEWMELFLELERYADGMRPNASARAIAYINLAAYETAVDGMNGFQSNDGKIRGLNVSNNRNSRGLDFELALNACYADVFDHFIINLPSGLESEIDQLESTLENRFSRNNSAQEIRDSKNFGARVAQDIINFAKTDVEAEAQILDPQPDSYVPPTGPGYWTFSAEPERALFPYWETVRTFVIEPDQTSTVAPIPYSNNPGSDYYAEMMEVYTVNNRARDEDAEELWIAEFWSDDVGGLTFGPPSRQVAIANQLIEQFNYNLQDALHMYLKLGFSLNDAAVSTWKYKYEYMVMRPSVFIHDFIDPNYQTNLYRLIPWPNPTFPGYPSGHSCFASAAAGVFIDFFGDNVTFTDRSHEGRTEFRGAPRTFNTLSDMAAENAFSRIPLGVHIRMDCEEGLRLGYEISESVNDYDLTSTRRRSSDLELL